MNMKTVFSTIAGGLLAVACTTDAYDKGEGSYSYVKTELVCAHIASDQSMDYIDTDEGERLTVSPAYTARWIARADTTYRAIAYYDCKTEGVARMLSSSRVSVVVPRPATAAVGDIKTDPVRMESMWVSTNRRYLNATIYVLVGSTDDDEAVHRLGLIADTLTMNADSTTTLHVRLYHDQGGVPEYYSQRAVFSVPLDSITADSISFTVNTYAAGNVIRRFSTF